MQPSERQKRTLRESARRARALVAAGALAFGLSHAAVADAPAVKEYGVQAIPFDLRDVRLLDGPFRHAMELDRQYLLSLDVDRLLHNFRITAGLPSSSQPLGGWEDPKCEVRGSFIGHYMSACALLYASTGDERLKAKGDVVVAGLAACQEKLGSGYLSAFPEGFIDRVERQLPVWAPWYTLHKIFAGLLDMYVHGGNPQALEVARKFGDWVQTRTEKLSDQQMQHMLGTEHGGMNEVLANLYGLTGEAKYLATARRFNHMAVLGPASKGEDKLTGLHANTQIPKFIGAARQYELTGDEWPKTAALFFWETVVKERSYVIGGNSDRELFSPKEKLSQTLSRNTAEACNTYNMLKLTRHLFQWAPRAEYADYYERALYNHILASQHPETGMMCYYMPLAARYCKQYNGPPDTFWCCVGTGFENHAKYGDSIYFHDGAQTLYVNLFIASELNWRAQRVTLRQETKYPDEAASRLVLTCAKPARLTLHIRYPSWAVNGFQVTVNGKPQKIGGAPGAYVTLARKWMTGDTIGIAMPFGLRTESFRDNPRRLAFLDGPLMLAAEIDRFKPAPFIVAEDGHLLDAVQPVPGRPSTFAGSPAFFRILGADGGQSVTLEPFYKIHGARYYAVYWDVLTPRQWQVRQAAEGSRQKDLDERTVDSVRIGEEPSERAHQIQGDDHRAAAYYDRRSRLTGRGGWFSYTLKVLPDQATTLLCTYWGSDGGQTFDVIVEGQTIATQSLNYNKPEEFFDVEHKLPTALTAGKTNVVVRFQGQPHSGVGGVFGCRTLK